jgi:hypothetical protein
MPSHYHKNPNKDERRDARKPPAPKAKAMSKPKKQTIEIRGQKIEMEKGRLHKDLGIPEERKIPMTLLRKLVKVPNGEMFEHHGKNKKMTAPLKKRISLAITLKGFKK